MREPVAATRCSAAGAGLENLHGKRQVARRSVDSPAANRKAGGSSERLAANRRPRRKIFEPAEAIGGTAGGGESARARRRARVKLHHRLTRAVRGLKVHAASGLARAAADLRGPSPS